MKAFQFSLREIASPFCEVPDPNHPQPGRVRCRSAGILTVKSSLDAMPPWGETRVSDYGNALYRSEVLQCFWKLLNQLDEKSSVSVGFAPALLPALHGSWVGTDCAGKEGA